MLLHFLLAPASNAFAAEGEITILSLSQEDTNGDGAPDLTTLDCAFATAHDRVYVVDQARDMRVSDSWQAAADFDDDIWLYDIGADGSVQLIVVYRVEEGQQIATLYDDRDGDGQVSYERSGTAVSVLESDYWTVRFISSSTWYLPDGRLNLNMKMEQDGIANLYRLPDSVRQTYILHDGMIDVESETVAGEDGIVRYTVMRLVADVPYYYYFTRTAINSNDGRVATTPYHNAFFPFLPGSLVPEDFGSADLRTFQLPPRLEMDWAAGKVSTGWGIGGFPAEGWSCVDDEYLLKGQVNEVSHECPLAWYDLAGDHDAFPELNLRMFYYPIGDARLHYSTGREDMPYQEIYYSWNQTKLGSLNWDYKIGLADTHRIDAVDVFPDFSLFKVPFDEFPAWITSRTWKLSTFVAVESGSVSGSEGIWDWNPFSPNAPIDQDEISPWDQRLAIKYLVGSESASPESYFTTINQGLRGERNFTEPALPRLYFSAMDHKLHLLGAQYGVWNINGQEVIEYNNLDGDDYLDQWLYLVDSQVSRQVNSAAGYVLYSGDGIFALKMTDQPPALLETQPPVDHVTWLRLGEQLEANQPAFDPTDFAAMLAQFGAPDEEIQGAALSGFRPTAEGFRFVLSLLPGFYVQSGDLLYLQDKLPGDYVVTYNGAWQVAPLTPPALRVEPVQAGETLSPQQALQESILSYRVYNDGLADAEDVVVTFSVSRGGSEIIASEPVTVTVLGGEVMPVSFPWQAASEGEWALDVEVRQVGSEISAQTEQIVQVAPAAEPSLEEIVTAFGLVRIWQTTLLWLAMAAGAAAFGLLVMRILTRELSQREEPPG